MGLRLTNRLYSSGFSAPSPDSPDRLDAGKDLCRQLGAERIGFYRTMGIHDLVLVIDAPNDHTMARIAVSRGKGGTVRTLTLKTFDENPYREIVGSVG